jgi:tetratricopeptide (TPR) repeat protein
VLACLITTALMPVCHAVQPDEVDEADARVAAERFLTILVKNPRFGTAFDRVYGFCIDRGSIAKLKESLRAAANLPVEFAPAEGTITSDMVTLELPETLDAGAACLLFGMIELRHSEADTSSRVLKQAAELRPKDPVAHWYLAKAMALGQKFDAAAAALEQAIASRPAKIDLLEIYKELARLHQRAQKPDAALAVWERLEKEFPGDLRVKEQIAATLTEDGRWEEALVRYQALVKDTRNADQRVQSSLAASDVLIQLGRTQEAIAVLETQLSDLDPDSWLYKEIRRRIEGTFRSRNDLPGLVAYYEQWLSTHADDVDAMARLARTLSLQNETASAAEWYRKAIALAPSNQSLRESLIEQLVREDKIADAIAQYDDMSKFDTGNPDHLEDWGQLIISQKDVPQEERQKQAADVWNRMLENRADDSVTLARLAGLFRRADVRERAMELYRSAIEKSPNKPQYREYLGEYLHELQRTDEAIAEWKQIAEGDRRTKANLIRLAEVLNRFGQSEQALAAMREACEMNPEPTERLQFAEMLRTRRAAGREPSVSSPDPTTVGTIETAANSEGLRPPLAEDEILTEALQQLDLAEQSTEAADERQQILNERVKCLQVAGQLESEIQKISVELTAGTNVTADRWRILATHQDAAEKLNEATASAIKVVELEPESIPGWTILADLYERTGRLGDAADAMKKLASLDRRGISEYLRKTARLQVRLGQFEEALATGREIIKATPGNPEAYQFFADLAFEVGQPKEAVESLRRAVRVNPGDEDSLRALAKTLADEFQTPEAIELYWRAFEKAADFDSQTQIVVALSNLYLRSNQFPKLIERLELRSRELNLPTEMTRCIATAYREAGDFRKARETLEALVVGDVADVELLRRLVTLSLEEQSVAEAIAYQRDVVSRTAAAGDVAVLRDLLKNAGLAEETDDVTEGVAGVPDSPQALRASLSGPISLREARRISDSYQTYVAMFPDDWAILTTVGCVLADMEQTEEAIEVAERVIRSDSLANSIGTLSSLPVLYPHSSQIEKHSKLLGNLYEVASATFLDAYCRCSDIVFLQSSVVDPEILAEFFSADSISRLGCIPIVFVSDHLEKDSVWTPVFIETLSSMAQSKEIKRANQLLLKLLNVEMRMRLKVSSDAEYADFRETFVAELKDLLRDSPRFFFEHGVVSRISFVYAADPGGRELLLSTLHAALPDLPHGEANAVLSAFGLLLQDYPLAFDAAESCRTSGVGEESAAFFEALDQAMKILPQHLSVFAGATATDPDFLLTQAKLVCRYSRLPENSRESIDDARIVGRAWRARLFPPSRNELELSPFVFSHTKGNEEAFSSWMNHELKDPDPLYRARLHLLLAELDDSLNGAMHLILAAAEMPEIQGLRFDAATEAARFGMPDEALELLETITLTDPASRIAIEIKALEWSMAAGRTERSVVAAERLFGLPLSTDQQQQLASRLSQLKLNDKLTALNSRLGRGSETRQSVLARQLQTYTAQGNNELAGEVAWELLKLASGGTLFSGQRPNDDRDDGGERLQAIKALGKLGRLQPLIDRYEAMLNASPESLDLLEILCEFHEAAEQFPQLSEKRDRIALLSRKAPPSLKAKAVAMENSGDVSGACEIYLQILKDDPQAFAEEMETYVQAFERARRHADFLTAVLGVDEQYWSEHAGLIVNMIADLARAKTNDEVVQKSIETMLANEETRRFAIGGFLARAEVIAEEELLPAIQSELTSEEAFSDISRINQSFLILQAVKNESSLKTLHEFLLSRRAAGRQPSVSNSELPLLYVTARLGLHEQVKQQVAAITSGDLEAASLQPKEILTLNTRLKELSKDWDRIRTQLLEYLVSLKIEDTETADIVLDELGAAWESLGELQKARRILNQRVQKMLVNTGAATGDASESIRQLLQAGEKIQHSGFPIEGARLLLNVTPHDIDEFTDDLDDDKAIAFKSRFNASQRWARQQISAEKLVAWYAMAVDDVVAAAADPKKVNGNLADQPADLLLELSGTTDPRCRTAEELRGLRLDSVLLAVVSKSTFDSEELRKRIKAATETLLAQSVVDVRLLTVALALAIQTADEEMIKQICDKSLEVAGTASNSLAVADKAATVGRHHRIPEILRSETDLSCVLMAGLVANREEQQAMIGQLLQRSNVAANRSANRLIKVAVLQECVAVSKRAGLSELVVQCEQLAAAAVDEQIKATSVGIEGEIDLAHEIRTRLLRK